MSYRDDCLITTLEEAADWLERYRHTITDPQVLAVIAALEADPQGLQEDIDTLEDEVDRLTSRLNAALEAADEWEADYVVEDTAPRTVREHIERALEEAD